MRRCLGPITSQQQLDDALTDGVIDDDTHDSLTTFREFLKVAGPADGQSGRRLRDAGRDDLIGWAQGEQ